MPYTLESEPAAQRVRVTFTAHASAGERREAYVALGELAAATGATRALIDVSAMRATYATMVSYDHAVRLVASLPHGVRLAVLLSADPAQLGAAAFVRDVANNRGLTLELFATLEAALAWLEGGEATTGVARAVV